MDAAPRPWRHTRVYAVARGSYDSSRCAARSFPFFLFAGNRALSVLLTGRHMKCCLAVVMQRAVSPMIVLSLSSSVTRVPEKYANVASSVQKAALAFRDCSFFFSLSLSSVENATVGAADC